VYFSDSYLIFPAIIFFTNTNKSSSIDEYVGNVITIPTKDFSVGNMITIPTHHFLYLGNIRAHSSL